MKIAGIILAGGASRRMGRPKALLPFQGESFLDRLIGLFSSVCDRVVVVLGHDPDTVLSGLSRRDQATFVINGQHHLGQLSSLQRALSEISDEYGFAFTPVDYPAIRASTLQSMISLVSSIPLAHARGSEAPSVPLAHARGSEAPSIPLADARGSEALVLSRDRQGALGDNYDGAFDRGTRIIRPRYHGERGHPVLCHSSLRTEFLGLPTASQARDVVHRHVGETIYVDVDDPGVIRDADDPAAYRELLALAVNE